MHRDKIPFILLAMDQTEIIGAAQLKYREMEKIFPEKEHWLGGIYTSLGWQPIEQVTNHGLEVLVMERHVGN